MKNKRSHGGRRIRKEEVIGFWRSGYLWGEEGM